MHKSLIVAVNAKYNHTNIAVRSLVLYAGKPDEITFEEWTINQPVGEILRGIVAEQPDYVLFSTYIWNIEIVEKLVRELKKILPDCIVGAGGPEVSYYAEEYLKKLDALDFVIVGEGEETVKELVNLYEKAESRSDFTQQVEKVRGMFLKVRSLKDVNGKSEVIYTGDRELICDLDKLPFPYPEITDPDNKIYYYESCRGCPFSCAYCMSSLDKKVRYLSLDRVYKDIQRFLDANVKLVKFVDRTFNLNPERYLAIWKYIVSHHNGKTMFHFEIEAEYLDEKALEFLQTVPENVMQFEIGVQSSNKKTLKAVGRSENVEKLFANIQRIPESIHCHLDLIAGLPFEDLKIFGQSYDDVMNLFPNELQLGFLKILHGTSMEKYAVENGWKWMDTPPYETLSTPYMSFEDLMFLKDIEFITDIFWNSGNFKKSIRYAGRIAGFWNFMSGLTKYCLDVGAFDAPHSDNYWLEFLLAFSKDISFSLLFEKIDNEIFYELLRFDYLSLEKRFKIPLWYLQNYDKDRHKEALISNGGINNARLDYAFSDFDSFSVNPFADKPEETKGKFEVLFRYERKGKYSDSIKDNRTYQILL